MTSRPLALLPILVALPAFAGELPKRTLPELIAIARQRSTLVAAARSQVAVRQAQKSEALRMWWPSGEITGALTLAPRVQCDVPAGERATLDAISNDPRLTPQQREDTARQFRRENCINTVDPDSIDPVTHQPKNVDTLSPNIGGIGLGLQVRLTQPIYTFGKIEHGTRAAGKGIQAEEARTDAARNESDLNVSRAYWGLKAARTSRITAGDGRDDLAGWVKKVEEDLDSDKPKYTVNDLQRLKVAVIQVDLVLADLDRNIAIAEGGLVAAVGEPSEIDEAELDPVEIVDRPLGFYQQAALLHRPEVRALDAGVEALRELQKLKFSEMLPDIALIGTLDAHYAPSIEDAQTAFVSHGNQFAFGFFFTLRLPIDYAERHARYLHARADADVLAAQRALALTGIGFEIARGYGDLGEARRRLQAADRGQHVAQGWLNAVKQNFDLGIADSRDLVEAARAYYELRLRYYQAIHDMNVQTAVLRKAAGIDVAR